ncbi:hypothetical protein LINGRAHAP2_LOCUS24695 [Linum grandiflorum]
MRPLSCSFRISTNNNGRLLSLTFTAKQIMMRIIWPIFTTLMFLVYTFWIRVIGVYPSDLDMTLLVLHSLGV